MNTQNTLIEARLLQIEQDNDALKAENARLSTRFEQAHNAHSHMQRRLRRQTGFAFLVVVVAIFFSPANRAAMAQGYGTTLAQLLKDVTVLQNKTQYLSVNGKETYLAGTNLHIVNGTGSTATTNSLGNLIVGYNELGNTRYGDTRSGSHNIIVGVLDSYASYGGLVVGFSNSITNSYASVSGGIFNQASGSYSSISGGADNQAQYDSTSVTGGYQNIANGQYSSISGGGGNITYGIVSSISGGNQSDASGRNSSVSGGNNNHADADLSSISGGHNNYATGNTASISGGESLTQSAMVGWSGGSYHTP